MRPRMIVCAFLVMAMMLAATAGTAAAQDPVLPCLNLPEPDPGLDPAIESVYMSVTAIRDGVMELGNTIASTDDCTFVEVVQHLPPGAISAESDGQLAETGSELELLAIAALMMVAGGAMLVVVSRRRYASD